MRNLNKIVLFVVAFLFIVSCISLKTSIEENVAVKEDNNLLSIENTYMKSELDSIKSILKTYNVKFEKNSSVSSGVIISYDISSDVKIGIKSIIDEAKYKPSIMPLSNLDVIEITSKFGKRIHPIKKHVIFHSGIDYSVRIGRNVKSTADGRVIDVIYSKTGYGNRVIIKHGKTYKTLYAHLSKIKVRINQKIYQGDIIALTGNSGTSTGPHLHYEVIKDNLAINPQTFYYDNLAMK